MGTDTLIFMEHDIEDVSSLEKCLNEIFPYGIGVGDKAYYQEKVESEELPLWSWELPPKDEFLSDMSSNIWGPEGISLYVSHNVLGMHISLRWRTFLDEKEKVTGYLAIPYKVTPSTEEVVVAPEYFLDQLEKLVKGFKLSDLVSLLKSSDIEYETIKL